MNEILRLERDNTWQAHCAVFMPDHIHLLVTLGEKVDLSTAMRSFKGRLTPKLRESHAHWQPGFYDHRLRHTDDLLPVFLYIFLNPYRAGLCQPDQTWSGYYCSPEDWSWFGPLTASSCPEPGWLQ